MCFYIQIQGGDTFRHVSTRFRHVSKPEKFGRIAATRFRHADTFSTRIQKFADPSAHDLAGMDRESRKAHKPAFMVVDSFSISVVVHDQARILHPPIAGVVQASVLRIFPGYWRVLVGSTASRGLCLTGCRQAPQYKCLRAHPRISSSPDLQLLARSRGLLRDTLGT